METITTAVPRVMIVGTGSGAGKTTVTCGILQALVNRAMQVASFKCGPDYIDPMFHSRVIGTKARNLDLFMCGEETVRFLLARNGADCEFSVIEGVMGMYDGLSFDSDEASSNQLALRTQTPELLVVNVKGMSLSAAAMIGGFLNCRKNNIKGVIFNQCSSGMYSAYRSLVEKELGLKAYGFFPPLPAAAIESRHLGLVTADEIGDLEQKLALLAETAEACVDLDGLLALGSEYAPLTYQDRWQGISARPPVKIGVARDKAFCFFYQDNLDLLEKLGAELVFFSPLADEKLPKGISGLLLYGGYPEEYATLLEKNQSMRESVRPAVVGGMPTLAECGGFMYLLEQMADRAGDSFAMAGAINGGSHMTARLSRFGYLTMTAKKDNLLCKKGEQINGHEFHYSDSDNNGAAFTAAKRGRAWDCIHGTTTLWAGYPHLHFAGSEQCAVNFVEKCHVYQVTTFGNERV